MSELPTDINAKLISAIQQLLDAYAREATFPGGAQHLARENAELLLKEIRSQELQAKQTDDTIYVIASDRLTEEDVKSLVQMHLDSIPGSLQANQITNSLLETEEELVTSEDQTNADDDDRSLIAVMTLGRSIVQAVCSKPVLRNSVLAVDEYGRVYETERESLSAKFLSISDSYTNPNNKLEQLVKCVPITQIINADDEDDETADDDDEDCVHIDSHNPAYIDPKNLLLYLQNLLANPPGLAGIHCAEGHIGNKYVDAGYEHALSMVVSHINHTVMVNPSCQQ